MAIIDYLKQPKGANKRTKRRGLGQGSGHGKTACRGHKGQTARGNTKKYKGVEGGQMPLMRRLPKRGFASQNKKEYQLVSSKELNILSGDKPITPELMKKKGFIKDVRGLIKVLSADKFKKSLEVHAHAFSKAAKLAIEEAGGSILILKKRSPVGYRPLAEDEAKKPKDMPVKSDDSSSKE